MKNLFLAAGLGLGLAAVPALAQDKPVLTVYTYDSFNSDWGPGPAVEAAFEATCDCDLQFVTAGDAAALLARVQLEGERTKADVVLGLDTNLTARARETGLFAPHGVTLEGSNLPVDWTDPDFLPFDWGYFAFVYDKTRLSNPPHSFEDLAARANEMKIVIQDPRSSTPGLGLLMWVKAAYGDRAPEIWERIAPAVLTVTPGWSEAYTLFLEGEADMVLSYTTSPAYHIVAEGDDTKAAATFDEGHYMQIEVAGKLASTDQPALADAFLRFMVSDGFQSIVPTTNWMYPAVVPATPLDAAFAAPVPADKALVFSPEDAQAIRDAALEEWRQALSR